MKKRNINKLDKNIVMIKSINKRLMKAKLKHYKNTKKESKNMILICKPKYFSSQTFLDIRIFVLSLLSFH